MRLRRVVRTAVIVLVVLWPTLLAWTLVARVADRVGLVSAAVDLAAAQICHRRPDRSFVTAGAQWPVCGRCAGLYLAAPVGVLVASRRRRRPLARGGTRRLVVWAAVPTALTLCAEWLLMIPVTNGVRALAAAPLAVAVVAAILAEFDESAGSIK